MPARDGNGGGDGDDARVLDVMFDTQGERWRPWKSVVSDSRDNFYEDLLVDGPRTALWMMKHMEKVGATPVGWYNRLLTEKKMSSHDRVGYELQAWARVLETAGCYDQLNLPTLAWAEMAIRRVALLLDAHNRDPVNPKFDDDEAWSGQHQAAEGIPPSLSSHVASKLKERAEIEKQRTKAAEARKPGGQKR